MAGSLGDLVVKVSANADRFKQVMGSLKGDVGKLKADLSSSLGEAGHGFLQGLGIGSASQLVSGVTREVGELTRAMAMAAFEGKNVGDALDSWASKKIGIKGVTEMFDEARSRMEGIRDLGKKAQGDIDKAMGKKETPGQSRVDEFEKRISALQKEKAGVDQRIAGGWNFGQEGDLKMESLNLTGAIQQLELMKSQFTEDITKATAFAEAQDLAKKKSEEMAKALEKQREEATRAMDAMMQKGAALAQALQTPQEKYNATLADTQKLLSVGAINLDTFRRQAEKSATELVDAMQPKTKIDTGAIGGVGAVEAGTSEGFSAVQSGFRAQDALARSIQSQVETQNRQLEVQRLTKEATEKGLAAVRQELQKNTTSVERVWQALTGRGDAMPPAM